MNTVYVRTKWQEKSMQGRFCWLDERQEDEKTGRSKTGERQKGRREGKEDRKKIEEIFIFTNLSDLVI